MEENFDVTEYNESEMVLERRKEQFELRLRGEPRAKINALLSDKYGVVPTTIDQDWQRRDTWILEVAGVTDVKGMVAATVGSLNLSQSFRKKVLDSLLDLCDRFSPDTDGGDLTETDLAALEELPIVWNMLMKLLNDMDASEKNKADILFKLGVLKEAPKKYIVDKKETKIEHKIDWGRIAEGLDEDARRKLFNEIDAIDIEGSVISTEEEDA